MAIHFKVEIWRLEYQQKLIFLTILKFLLAKSLTLSRKKLAARELHLDPYEPLFFSWRNFAKRSDFAVANSAEVRGKKQKKIAIF
jgi:hypothetical protein